MAAAIGCPPDSFLNASPSEHAAISAAAQRLGLETVLAMMQILDHTIARLRWSTYGRTLAELALVRIASLSDLENLADLVAELRNGATSPPSGSSSPAVAVTPSIAKKKDDLTPSGGRGWRAAEAPANSPATGASLRSGAPSGSGHPALSGGTPALNARQLWDQALSLVENMTADHARAASGVAIRAPDQLAVVFSAKYNFSKAFCEPRSRGETRRGRRISRRPAFSASFRACRRAFRRRDGGRAGGFAPATKGGVGSRDSAAAVGGEGSETFFRKR